MLHHPRLENNSINNACSYLSQQLYSYLLWWQLRPQLLLAQVLLQYCSKFDAHLFLFFYFKYNYNLPVDEVYVLKGMLVDVTVTPSVTAAADSFY